MRIFFLRAYGLAGLAMMLSLPGLATDVTATARAVDEHYNSLKSFKAASDLGRTGRRDEGTVHAAL